MECRAFKVYSVGLLACRAFGVQGLGHLEMKGFGGLGVQRLVFFYRFEAYRI